MRISKTLALSLLLTASFAVANAEVSNWVSLANEDKNAVKRTVISEVDKRDGYSTQQEEAGLLRLINEEKAREDAAYKNGIAAAKGEFARAKNKRDHLTSQLQSTSSEIEELHKEIDTLKAGMANYDSQIARYQDDIKVQQDALKKWLKTEKQGEALVAVIYTRGFKDKKHELDLLADRLSAPVMAADIGTYIQAHTKVVNNVLEEDFIQAVSQGTAKWNGEEPILIELGKGSKGTDYLRIKRYELYPFQDSNGGEEKRSTGAGSDRVKVALIGSMYNLGTFLGQNGMYNLETFLTENGHKATSLDLSRVEIQLAEIAQTNKLAAEGLNEQVHSIQDRINALSAKIKNARSDKETLAETLARKQALLAKEPTARFNTLSATQREAEKVFQAAQAALHAKNSVRETIIVKSVLTTPRGSQSPAEAASEAIIDKLEEVRNEARSQHASTTTTVSHGQLVEETTSQAVTQAKIVGMKLVSILNEGDSVNVKIAFKVRMALESHPEEGEPHKEKTVVAKLPETPEKKGKKTKKAAPAAAKSPVAAKPPVAAKAPAVEREASPKAQEPERETEREEPAKEDAEPLQPTRKAAPRSGDGTAVTSAESNDFVYTLKSAKTAGAVTTFLFDARNKAGGTRYLALYDQTARHRKSRLVDGEGIEHEVQEVFLWDGSAKISSSDAYRGIPVQAGASITLELNFKEVRKGNGVARLLTLHPYTATKVVVYRWNESEVPFANVAFGASR